MGHTRLGALPRTRRWKEVVALLSAGADVNQLATATINAAERALNLASNDPAIVESIYLLMQLPLSARTNDFVSSLREAGIEVPDAPGLMDVVAAFTEAVERRLPYGRRTDLGEMAQMAATETIASAVGGRITQLFEVGPATVEAAFATLATEKQFSGFAKQFFTRLTDRVLNYFLSRAYSNEVGEGKRFATLGQHERFNEAMTLHCGQASVIVEAFSGEWFGKTNWQKGGISKESVSKFAYVAMQKLVSELKAGARDHA